MRDRARQRARELLRAHWPSHLPQAVDDQIRAEFDIRLPRERMRPPARVAGQ
jgi:trimethylamine--corrinoid protein Co-methyltransferase